MMNQDRDDIKFIPIAEDSSRVQDPEGPDGLMLMDNMMMTDESFDNSSHRDLDPSSWGSAAVGFRKLASIMMNTVHMTRRTIRRELGPYKKAIGSRLNEVEARTEKLEGDVGKLERTVEKHDGDMGELKGGLGKLAENVGDVRKEMAEMKGNFQLELDNLKNFVFALSKQRIPRTEVVQNQDAAGPTASDPTISNNNGADARGTLRTPEPPVLQSFWALDPLANNPRPASYSDNDGQIHQAEGHISPGSTTGQEQVQVVRIHERVSTVPQIVGVRGNDSGKVKEPNRRPCQYCSISFANSYVRKHELHKCALRPMIPA